MRIKLIKRYQPTSVLSEILVIYRGPLFHHSSSTTAFCVRVTDRIRSHIFYSYAFRNECVWQLAPRLSYFLPQSHPFWLRSKNHFEFTDKKVHHED
jgi:hypothetical protein